MADQKNIVKASLRDLRLAPRKVSIVAALVRGRSVEDAIVILSHTPRRAAKPLQKLIESARANAANNHGLIENGLMIESISVTAGPRMKRYRPVSRGMAHPFQKRTSHIFVTLAGTKKPVKKAADKPKETASSETKQKKEAK